MPTIGETLKSAREKKKINIDVAAKAVKVKTESLECIERDDFSIFSAPVYARGILRLYATYLDLEPETLVQEYNDTHPAGDPVKALSPEAREQTLKRKSSVVISTVSKPSELSGRGVALLVGVVFALAIGMWWIGISGRPKADNVQPIAPHLIPLPEKQDPVPTPPLDGPLTLGTLPAQPQPETNTTSHGFSDTPTAIPATEVDPFELGQERPE